MRQRRLAVELRRLREAANMTMSHATRALGWSISKLSRIETAQIGARPRDVADLLTLYGVDGQQRKALVLLAQEARQKSWYQEYRDIPSLALVVFEADAASIYEYSSMLVPGLLQTEAYAHAVLKAIRVELPATEIERRVELRMVRQALLTRGNVPTLWVVLDEAAVRRQIGGPDVMREQVKRLCEVAEQRIVTLQVLPFAGGEHAGLDGGFTILRFSEPDDPDIVYVENLGSDLYLDEPEPVDRYRLAFDHLRATALPPGDSVAFLAMLAREP